MNYKRLFKILLYDKPLLTGILFFIMPIAVVIGYAIRPYVTMQEDAWLYMTGAVNILNGRGYVDSDWMPIQARGPMLSIIMAISMWMNGGTTPENAIILVVVINLIGLLFLGLIGERFIGKGVGIMGVGIILNIPFLKDYLFSRLMTDGLQSGLFITYLFFCLLVIETGNIKYWRFIGVILGIAFLAKESSILWAPLPLIMILIDRRITPNNLRLEANKLLNFISYFFISIFPWFVYFYQVTGNIFFMDRINDQIYKLQALVGFNLVIVAGIAVAISFGLFFFLIWKKKQSRFIKKIQSVIINNTQFVGLLLLVSFFGFTFNYVRFDIVINYIQTQILSLFPFYLSLILWLIWIWIAFRSKNICYQFILLAGSAYFPIFSMLAKDNNHPRNLIGWMMLSCLLLPAILLWVSKKLRFLSGKKVKYLWGLISILLFGVAFINSVTIVRSKDLANQYRQIALSTSRWIKDSVPEGETMLVKYYARREIYVLTGGKYRLVPLTEETPKGWRSLSFTTPNALFTNSVEGEDPVVIQAVNTSPEISNNYLAVYPTEISNKLQAENAPYVIITGDGRASPLGFTQFFYCWRNSKLLNKFFSSVNSNEAAYIYKVDLQKPKIPNDCTTTTDTLSLDFMLKQAEQMAGPNGSGEVLKRPPNRLSFYPLRWQPYNGYLKLAKISQDQDDIFGAKAYYSLAASFRPKELLVDLIDQNQVDPDNELILIALADTYYYLGQSDKALEFFVKALNANSQSDFVLYSLGEYYFWEKDFDKAEKYLHDAIQLKPNSFEYRLKLVETYISMGNYEDAGKALLHMEQEWPLSSKVQNYRKLLEVSQLMQGGDLAGAVNLFNQYKNDLSIANNNIDHITAVDLIDLYNKLKFSENKQMIREDYFIIDDAKRILFMHAPSVYAFTFTVPEQSRLETSYTLSPEIWNPKFGDGVEFIIEITPEDNAEQLLLDKYIDPKNKNSHQKWFNHSISLSKWAGQTVTLTFETTPGPMGDARYDWAGWSEPRITVPVSYDFLSNFDQSEKSSSDTSQIRADQMDINYETRPVIFAHPNSRIAYNITLTTDPTLMFGVGMDPSVWDPAKGDGVEYNIYIARSNEPEKLYRVYHRIVDPKNNLDVRQWLDERVNLSQFGGQEVKIIFETTAGPNGNSDFDWAGWSRPVLVDGLNGSLEAQP